MDPAPETTAAPPPGLAPAVEVDLDDPSTLPGYAEAIQADQVAHDLAFLGDVPRMVADCPCLPLDLRTLLILIQAGNPFLCGGPTDVADVRQFLWHLHPAYRASDIDTLDVFVECLAELDLDFARAEIRRFLDDTFTDSPGGQKRTRLGRDGRPLPVQNPTSFVATWVDLLASEYGWDEDRIVGTPERRGVALTRLYQYRIAIQARRGVPMVAASARAMRLVGDWLRGFLPTPSTP